MPQKAVADPMLPVVAGPAAGACRPRVPRRRHLKTGSQRHASDGDAGPRARCVATDGMPDSPPRRASRLPIPARRAQLHHPSARPATVPNTCSPSVLRTPSRHCSRLRTPCWHRPPSAPPPPTPALAGRTRRRRLTRTGGRWPGPSHDVRNRRRHPARASRPSRAHPASAGPCNRAESRDSGAPFARPRRPRPRAGTTTCRHHHVPARPRPAIPAARPRGGRDHVPARPRPAIPAASARVSSGTHASPDAVSVRARRQ